MAASSPKPERIRHNFTALCEHAVIDRAGRVSLINVVRNVALPGIPSVLARLAIVSSFTAPIGARYYLTIEDPAKHELARSDEQEVGREEGDEASRYVQRSTQVMMIASPAVFHRDGVHAVVLKVNGKSVHREPFGVFVATEPGSRE
jgi:hypothetical protein